MTRFPIAGSGDRDAMNATANFFLKP